MNVYRLNVNGQQYLLTTWNCQIFTFRESQKEYNHLYILIDDEGNGMYVFDRQDLLDTLIEDGNYPHTYLPLVPPPDLAAFARWKKKQRELAELDPAINDDEVVDFGKKLREVKDDDIWGELGGEDPSD